MSVLQENLEKIYDISSERLRYAEGKNGALLAINSIVLFRLLGMDNLATSQFKFIYIVAIQFLCATSALTLISIIGRLNIPKMMKQKKDHLPKKYENFDNLLSSLRLAYYCPEEYARSVMNKLHLKDHELLPIEIDYAEHIISNAKVVLFKLKCFSAASICLLVGAVLIIMIKFSTLYSF